MPPERQPLGGAAVVVALIACVVGLLGRGVVAAEELPATYAGRTNPYAGDPAAVGRGRTLFLDNCSPCHGEAANGRGRAAAGLVPPPADLAGPEVVPRHSDAYLFYRLTVGKRGSAMPSFHQTLSEDDRWTIISYLRSLSGQK